VTEQQARTRRDWETVLGRVAIDLPPEARKLEQTLKTTLAYIQINRDGPAIQPGSRNYARSWIRDGAITSSALLEMGFTPEVRDFLRWYARYQGPDGKVPCCVDRPGADRLSGHDTPGAHRQARGAARLLRRGALRLDRPRHGAARDRLPPGLGRARRLRPDVDEHRARARRRARAFARARAEADLRAVLGGARGATTGRHGLGRVLPLRGAQRGRLRAPRREAARARSPRPAPGRPAAARLERVGRDRVA